MAKVYAINIIRKKGDPKNAIDKGEFIVGFGLKDDIHGGNERRQVSLMGQESIDKAKALGIKGLCIGKFTENITTEGIELYSLTVGTKLDMNGVIFEITQIGKECHQICAIFKQMEDCIMPKEVIFAKVISGGIVRTGDDIKIIPTI